MKRSCIQGFLLFPHTTPKGRRTRGGGVQGVTRPCILDFLLKSGTRCGAGEGVCRSVKKSGPLSHPDTRPQGGKGGVQSVTRSCILDFLLKSSPDARGSVAREGVCRGVKRSDPWSSCFIQIPASLLGCEQILWSWSSCVG